MARDNQTRAERTRPLSMFWKRFYLNSKCKIQNATDAAEREQKPSLTWIMPSREEEKPAKQG